MAQIFISYKRDDKEKVFKIRDKIEAAVPVKCWIDLDGIASSAVFASEIISAINDCEVFLFMYSKQHTKITDFENDWTIRELSFAQSKKKRIVFINIDGTELTDWFELYFGTKQQVNGKSEEALRALTTDLTRWLDLTPPPGPKPPRKSFWQKYKAALIAACIALVALVAAGVYYYNYGSEMLPPEQEEPTPLTSVDLGLPSGTLWANENVGAKSVSDFGKLFSWGETKTKVSYAANYYKAIPAKHIAQTQYDVATTLLGKEWQMPSEKDFKELLQYCTCTWETRYGHVGFKVTGKNGNSIFLPASGWCLSSTIEHRNRFGYYWTCDKVDDAFGRQISFDKTGPSAKSGYLHYGRCVRPVKKVNR